MQNCNKTSELPGLPPGGPAPAGFASKATWTAPRMTHAEKMARTDEKRSALLRFLASGEVWTTIELAGRVMSTSKRRAGAALDAMERDGLTASEILSYAGRSIKIVGITPHGIALADAFDQPAFEKGRINASYIEHHMDGQRARLAAEAAGWGNWLPERTMRILASKEGWKKVPDGIATNPAGERVAIEIERNCKTSKRYGELILAYLQEIKANRYKYVDFICPDGVEKLVEKSMARVTHVKLMGEVIEVTAAHRARFRFHSMTGWPGVSNG